MAQSQVTVSFGASVSGLVAGVQQAATAIQSLTAPVHQLNQAFSEIGEAAGISYAIDKIKELVENMSEIGEHAVNMGVALGMSAEQFQQLNEAMSLVGASGDALVRTERMLARTAETAIAQPISHQADAYKALGLDAHQFAETLRRDPIAALKELADAAVRTGNTALTGPLGWVLGRGADPNVLAFFAEGAAGIDKWLTKAKELGSPTTSTLETLKEIREEINEIIVAFTNLGATIVEKLNTPISYFLNLLKETAEYWRLMIAPSPVQPGPGAIAHGFGAPVGGATPEEQELLNRIKQHESTGRYDILHGPGGVPSGTITDFSRFPQWGGFMGPAGRSHAAGAYGFEPGTYADMAAITGYTSFLPEAQDINALQLLRTRGTAPWPWLGAGGGAAKMELPEVGVTADATKKQQMEDSIEAKRLADEQIKDIDRVTKARLAQLDFEKTAAGDDAAVVHQIEQQKLATVLEAEASKKAVIEGTSGAVRTALEHEHDLTTQIINVQNQAMRVDQQYHKEAVEAETTLLDARIRGLDAAEAAELKQVERERQLGDLSIGEAERRTIAIVKLYEEMVQEILGEEQKLATGIPGLQRRITAEQTRNIEDASQKTTNAQVSAHDEIQRSAKDMADGISHSLSGALTGVITGRMTVGQAGRQLGEEAMSKIMDTVMEKTVGRLIQNAIENLLQQLAGDAANTGILATLLSAILVKPSVAGTTLGMGGIIPGAAGGWVIPSFQSGGILAQLHGGEMVLPRDISEGMQGLIRGGGGGGSTINIHAIDTQSGGQFLMRNAGSVGQAALRYSNVSPRAVSAGGGRFP